MAKNPMQRKARNSFLLGMLVTFIVLGAVIGILVFNLINTNKLEKAKEDDLKEVYVAANIINSGDIIKLENLKKVKATVGTIPQNSINLMQIQDDTCAKIDIKPGTILSEDMLSTTGEKVTDDLRIQEYNMILLPSQINTDEYVDIRLRMPTGLDYIVVSKKKIEIPSVLGINSENTIKLKLNESEIETMSNAIVENYMMDGSILYVAKYVEPGLQKDAVPTYVPSGIVQEAIKQNANITIEARNELITRYNENINTRNTINSVLNIYNDKAKNNVEKAVEEEISNAAKERKKYLDALGE